MPTCCDCSEELPKASFAKSQLKKKPNARRCLSCAEKTSGSIANAAGTAGAAAATATTSAALKDAVKDAVKDVAKSADNVVKATGDKVSQEVTKVADKTAEVMPKTPFNSPEAKPQQPTNGGSGSNGSKDVKEMQIPDSAGKSARVIAEKGVEVMQSIGGTETAKIVEAVVGESSTKEESVDIAKPEEEPAEAEDFVVVESKVEVESDLVSNLPGGVQDILPSLTDDQRNLVIALCNAPCNQTHLFASWDADDTISKERKVALIAQLEEMDATYPTGGLPGYIDNARILLEKSRRGENPLEGWRPEVPRGEAFEVGTDRWASVEKKGLPLLGKCGFVLVAGGLGERLGYGDIKVSFVFYDTYSIFLPIRGSNP